MTNDHDLKILILIKKEVYLYLYRDIIVLKGMITLSDTVATYVGFSPDGNIIDTFNLKEGESLKHEKQKSEEQKKYLKNLTEIG